MSLSNTHGVQCDDYPRATSPRQPPSDSRVSQLEEENRSLRLRLAGSSSGPSGHDMDQTNQDAIQCTQAEPSSISSAQPTSSTNIFSSWSGDWLAEGGGERPPKKRQSPFLGLTSASVLEDTPGNFGEDQDNLDHFSTSPFPADSGHVSQRLETEAAKQRASSP